LIVRRPFTFAVRHLYVQSVTFIFYLCIACRLGSAARHHTSFPQSHLSMMFRAFSPSSTGFLITCTRINVILSLHVFLYKLFLYGVQYSIVINR
jgi:hypothetical protein